MKSLRDALKGHDNSLGLVRLIMAAAVIFDHSFPLGGLGTAPFLGYTRGQQSLGGLAVLGFLAVSGYLVAKSAMTSDVVQFLWRRFLRIFPGFWLALLLGAFVVGPAIWLADGRALPGYFSFGPDSPWGYLYNNWWLTISQYQVREVLVTTTPFGEAGFGGPINGSIWTLVYEFMCYLLLAGLLVIGVLARAKILVPIIAGFFFVMRVVNEIDQTAPGTVFPFFNDPWRLNFGFIFFVGATIALYSHRIPFDHRFGIAAGLGSVLLLRFGGFNTVGYVLFAYFILYFAAALPKQFHWIGSKNDYSYGVYLYGWVAQQILAYLGVHRLGYLPYAILSLICAFGFATVSWHLVERQALKLKDWGPGRGIRHWISQFGDLVRRRREAASRPATRTSPVRPVAPTAPSMPATPADSQG